MEDYRSHFTRFILNKKPSVSIIVEEFCFRFRIDIDGAIGIVLDPRLRDQLISLPPKRQSHSIRCKFIMTQRRLPEVLERA